MYYYPIEAGTPWPIPDLGWPSDNHSLIVSFIPSVDRPALISAYVVQYALHGCSRNNIDKVFSTVLKIAYAFLFGLARFV